MNSVLSKKLRANFSTMVLLAKLLLCTMAAYSFARVLFAFMNQQSLDFTGSDLLFSMLHGLRFDLSILTIINAVFFFISLGMAFWHAQDRYQRLFTQAFVVLNCPFLLMNFADMAYYPFTGRRSGSEVFAYWDDLLAQSSQLVGQYWLGIVLSLLLGLVYMKFCMWQKPKQLKLQGISALGFVFVAMVSLVFLNRGGLQKKPLAELHAYHWSPKHMAPATLNTPFVMFRAKSADIARQSWFPDTKAAYQALSRQVLQTQTTPQAKKNVVLIVLESFHRDMIRSHPKYGMPAPFLKTLTEQSLFYENAFANGRVSMDALPSTILGLPRLFKAPFIRTPYFNNHIESLPQLLKKYGYSSSLYHGAYNGSLYMDTFSEMASFDQFHGFNEYARMYPDKSQIDLSKWGIFDDQFMQYMAQDLSKKTQPFFATLFTLSSHNPYEIPERLAQKYPKENYLSLAYRSVHYSDDSLKQFFATAKKMPWYQDTVFLITADHSAYYWSRYPNHSDLGKHHVPMLIFDPSGQIRPQVSAKVVQHLDVPATVLDIVGVLEQESDHILPYGQSMLALNEPGHAFLRTSATDYLWVNDAEITRFNLPENSMQHQPLHAGMFSPRAAHEAPALSENRLKAAIQLYMNGMIDDRMYPQQLSRSQ